MWGLDKTKGPFGWEVTTHSLDDSRTLPFYEIKCSLPKCIGPGFIRYLCTDKNILVIIKTEIE